MAKVNQKAWHLVQNEDEQPLARFEAALWSSFQAFQRWEGECIRSAGSELSGFESSILNFIRMHEKPKALSDIAHFLSRDDLSNIQYTIRKLQQQGFIEKDKSKKAGRDTCYVVTETGYNLTQSYSELRRELLLRTIKNFGFPAERLVDAADMMLLMSGLYESNAREVVIYR